MRQGNPLSPLIFVLAADLLQAAVNDALRRGVLKHPIPPRTHKDFPGIQYADDTMIVMQACEEQARGMKKILLDYADSVGLRINFEKTTLVPINLDAASADGFAAIFGCTVGSMPLEKGLPPKILAHLDKIRRLCLWRRKNENGETENSLASWTMVCKPKDKGGLGVLDTKNIKHSRFTQVPRQIL